MNCYIQCEERVYFPYVYPAVETAFLCALNWLGAFVKNRWEGFPRGPVAESLSANAGDTGSIPDPGRSHMLQNNQARAPQLLSLCSGAGGRGH